MWLESKDSRAVSVRGGSCRGALIRQLSDRGVQYCSDVYVNRLREAGFQISMSRAGNPYDNAQAESFMRTLKCEAVYLADYRDAADARQRIGEFLEQYYHRKRPHSALGYLAPASYEEARG